MIYEKKFIYRGLVYKIGTASHQLNVQNGERVKQITAHPYDGTLCRCLNVMFSEIVVDIGKGSIYSVQCKRQIRPWLDGSVGWSIVL